jgi:hypothetical protein
MLNRTPRAAVTLIAILVGSVFVTAPAAHAGSVVLLSRDSTISAAAGDAVNMSDGSQGFDGFSNVVDTSSAGDATTPHLSANQHSQPAVDANSDFTGAFAEGSASADGSGSSDPAKTEAQSAFDLTFQVLNVPSLVSFGGSVGVSGGGSTSVELANKSTGEVLLSKELSGEDGQSIQHSELLDPGVYSLSVQAAVDGKTADEGMAYFSVNLSIAPASNENDGGGGPKAVPLPPAVWSAAATLLGAGGALRFGRRRSKIESN